MSIIDVPIFSKNSNTLLAYQHNHKTIDPIRQTTCPNSSDNFVAMGKVMLANMIFSLSSIKL